MENLGELFQASKKFTDITLEKLTFFVITNCTEVANWQPDNYLVA